MTSRTRAGGALALFLSSCSAASNVPGLPQRDASSVVRHSTGLSGLKVSGNQLLDAYGNAIHLQGVNRSGTEYACVQGWGIFDGPNDAASVQAIATWNVNIVRVLLNEDCWLNINGIDGQYAGQNYISAIVNYVDLLHQYHMYAEVSLIWASRRVSSDLSARRARRGSLA
jgi:hypothetical protein